MKAKTILLLVFIVSLPSIFPLFHPGLFLSDDAEWMIIRFSAFHQALVDGQFPVRWLGRLNHEYGYPVVNFNYPAFLYLAEIPKILGFGYVASIKIVLGVSMVLSAMFAYLWLAKVFQKFPALVGGLFYLYTPYHLFDLYKRGSVGEILALATTPFILWQIERGSLFWTSIGIGALVLSHNILAVLFLSVVIIYMLFRRVSGIKYQVLSIVFGLMIPSFFWIPAIFDLQYTVFSSVSVSRWQEHFAKFDVIGIASIVVILLALRYRNAIFFLAISLPALFLSLPLSSPLWNILPVALIQFPFRLLSILIVSTAFLSASILKTMKGKQKEIVAAILLVLLGVSAAPHIRPSVFFDKGEDFYATNQSSTTIHNEYMPKWVRIAPAERAKEKVVIVSGRGTVDVTLLKTNRVTFLANMESAGTVRVNTVYFPGWKSFVNGREVPIAYENERGTMEMNVSQGKNDVTLSFGETRVRFVSDALSLVGIGALLVVGLSQKQKQLLA